MAALFRVWGLSPVNGSPQCYLSAPFAPGPDELKCPAADRPASEQKERRRVVIVRGSAGPLCFGLRKSSPEGDLRFQFREPGLWSWVYTLFLNIIIIIIKGDLRFLLRGASWSLVYTLVLELIKDSCIFLRGLFTYLCDSTRVRQACARLRSCSRERLYLAR